jgi:hypothetical protein
MNKKIVAFACLTFTQHKTVLAIGPTLLRITQQAARNSAILSMRRNTVGHYMQEVINNPEQLATLRIQALSLRMQNMQRHQDEQDAQARKMRAVMRAKASAIAYSMVGLMPRLYQWMQTGVGYAK